MQMVYSIAILKKQLTGFGDYLGTKGTKNH